MKPEDKKKAIKEIKRLWNKAEYILNNRSMAMYGKELLRMIRSESQSHDRFRFGNDRGITITEESKFFALKRLLDSVYDMDYVPSLDDYHHTQKSVYMAYSLAHEFQSQIRKVITEEEAKYISKLDYCELIEVV